MRLLLSKNFYSGFLTFFLFVHGFCIAKEIPECPKSISIKDGVVIGLVGWSYSFPSYFINKDTKKITMDDGVLVSDYKFPEISQINTFTNTVTGGLSYDVIEETDTSLSLTWDIHSIHQTTTAVFLCNFNGDTEAGHPVKAVYLYKKVPREFKKCTVSYEMIEYERVPDSQKLFCK